MRHAYAYAITSTITVLMYAHAHAHAEGLCHTINFTTQKPRRAWHILKKKEPKLIGSDRNVIDIDKEDYQHNHQSHATYP